MSPATIPARVAVALVRGYRYTLSGLVGRTCRHWPSCSEYTEEAIRRHGSWAGGFIGLARICRCGPWGTSGIDLAPEVLAANARWFTPWRFGRWRGVNAPPQPREELTGPPTGVDRGASAR